THTRAEIESRKPRAGEADGSRGHESVRRANSLQLRHERAGSQMGALRKMDSDRRQERFEIAGWHRSANGCDVDDGVFAAAVVGPVETSSRAAHSQCRRFQNAHMFLKVVFRLELQGDRL